MALDISAEIRGYVKHDINLKLVLELYLTKLFRLWTWYLLVFNCWKGGLNALSLERRRLTVRLAEAGLQVLLPL